MEEPNSFQQSNNNFTLSSRDAQSLEEYFSEGKSTFAHSITGPMLTKADLYRHGSFRCYLCEDYPGINKETGEWCGRCKGAGYHSYELYKNKAEITAFPTAEVVEATGYEPSLTMLEKYGRISRRLNYIEKTFGSQMLLVLETYHGDIGARWGRTKSGRLFSLIHLTDTGKRMLKRAKNGDIDLSESETLGVESTIADIQPEKHKWFRDMKEQALVEAEILYDQAISAWIASGVHQGPANEKPQKPKKIKDKWVPSEVMTKDKGISYQDIRETVGSS